MGIRDKSMNGQGQNFLQMCRIFMLQMGIIELRLQQELEKKRKESNVSHSGDEEYNFFGRSVF